MLWDTGGRPMGSGGIRWEPPSEPRNLKTHSTPQCRLEKAPKAFKKPAMSMRHRSNAHSTVAKQVIVEKSICNATGQNILSTNLSDVRTVSGSSVGGKAVLRIIFEDLLEKYILNCCCPVIPFADTSDNIIRSTSQPIVRGKPVKPARWQNLAAKEVHRARNVYAEKLCVLSRKKILSGARTIASP
jgi:hypothetical protein